MNLPDFKAHTGVWCRMCDVEKRESNHWLRVSARFVNIEERPQPVAAFTVTVFSAGGPGDPVCGSECLMRYYNAWEEEHRK